MALLTLKIYRFEVAVALLLAVGAAGGGAWILFQLAALNVPAHCIDGWLVSGPVGRPECAGLMREWSSVMAPQGDTFFWAMTAVPFVVGLLVGAPLVARELETQTSQLAWWLNSSRLRWLAWRVLHVGVPLLAGLALASMVAGAVANLDEAWGMPGSARIGTHGLLVLARGAGTFGLAVLIGALIGNTLRTLVVASALALALFVAVPQIEAVWLQSLPRHVIGDVSPTTGEIEVIHGAITTGWGWRAPNGEIVNEEREGYEAVQLGVLQETAIGWQDHEMRLYSVIAVASLITAAVTVNSRRPF